MPYPTLTLLAAPVVDIDGTFFVQGGIFLLLCLLLNSLLFKPWLKVRELRTVRIDGALERSVQVLAEATALEEEYATNLKAARERGFPLELMEKGYGLDIRSADASNQLPEPTPFGYK